MLFAAGCSLPQRVSVSESGTPLYQQVDIVYQLSGSHGALEHASLERSVEDASGVESPVPRPSTWASAQLRIQCPHPSGMDDRALVTLQLSETLIVFRETDPTPAEQLRHGLNRAVSFAADDQPATSAELWGDAAATYTLEVPRYQLDLLLVDLADSGFFDDQRRPSAGSRLSVRIEGGKLTKTWSPDPRLDDFVTRTYRDGRQMPSK
jgi:hypothetical protein